MIISGQNHNNNKNNDNNNKQSEPWGSNLHSLKSLKDSIDMEDDEDLARAIALSKTTAV